MTKAKKTRADVALLERGLVESRTRAQALILGGKVFSGERRIDKAGEPIAEGQALTVREKDHPWVSRGGLKLDHGLTEYPVDLTGATVIDVGASTGGFTDVALAHGAARVYAVDVGQGQLDWKLRNDARVVVMEKTNARYLTTDDIPAGADAVVCDASFISLKTVLPAALSLVRPGGALIALIKPQFEVGKENVGKGGVVKDPALHAAVCDDIVAWLGQIGWDVRGVTESPIKGPAGNTEFLIAATKGAK